MAQKLIYHKSLFVFLLLLGLLLGLLSAGCAPASQPKIAALSVTASAKGADFVESRTAEQLWASPLPMPPFVLADAAALRKDFLPTDKMCVKVRQDVIWEPGDKQLTDFTKAVLEGSSVKVDNADIPLKRIIISQTLATVLIMDKDGNQVATVGDPLEYCVSRLTLSTLPAGLHKASIKVTATSGTVYAFAWAFHIAKASTFLEAPDQVV